MHDGAEMVRWEGRYDLQVDEVKKKLFGSEIASNSNVSFGDAKDQKAFTDWLSERGVKYQIVRSRGKDYVVWEGPESLIREYVDGLGRKCGDVVAATQAPRSPCE